MSDSENFSLLTLSRKDAQFANCIQGWHQGKFAVPVRTVNFNSKNELVTFELTEEARKKPKDWWWQLCRWPRFQQVFWPAAFLTAWLVQQNHPLNWGLVILAMVGLFGFVNGAYSFNDYLDHINGADRVSLERRKKILQQGWISARALFRWATTCWWFGGIIGGYFLVQNPLLVLVFLPTILLVGLEFIFHRNYRILREFHLFLLFGPLLCVGYYKAIGGEWSLLAAGFGIVWGVLVTFRQLLIAFSNSMFLEKVGELTVVRQFDFEGGRSLLVGFLVLWLVALSLFAFSYARPMLLLLLPAIGFVGVFYRVLFAIQSPISSSFQRLAIISDRFLFLFGSLAFFLGLGFI